MDKRRNFLLAAGVAFGLLGAPATVALADDPDPIFINLAADDAHRMDMALAFGGGQLKRGHRLTIFLNDHAVLAASKANAERFSGQQKQLADLVASGASVLVCQMCMKHFGVSDDSLLPGLKIANPENIDAALFQDDTKTLSW